MRSYFLSTAEALHIASLRKLTENQHAIVVDFTVRLALSNVPAPVVEAPSRHLVLVRSA